MSTEASATGPPVDPDRPDRRSLEAQHQLLLRGISNRLEGEFGEFLTRDTLEHVVADSYRELSSRAKVLTHIPAFVERFTKQRLAALAKNRGVVEGHVPEILFVCERNDAASQMAAALFNARAGGRATAHSAGSAPSAELLTEAVHVLHEDGIDLLGEFPKPITTEIEEAADVIVTLDRHDDIPVLDTKQHYAWHLPVVSDDRLEAYRELRNDLRARIDELIETVVPPASPRPHAAFDADLDELQALLDGMGDQVLDLGRRIGPALHRNDADELTRIIADDDIVDRADRAIGNRSLELIARRQPVAGDLRAILAMRDTALHLERIADGIVDIALTATRTRVATDSSPQLQTMASTVVTMTEIALRALAERSVQDAEQVAELDRALDDLFDSVFAELSTARVGGEGLDVLLTLDRVARAMKRAGEHALDIAEQAIFLATGEIVELGRA